MPVTVTALVALVHAADPDNVGVDWRTKSVARASQLTTLVGPSRRIFNSGTGLVKPDSDPPRALSGTVSNAKKPFVPLGTPTMNPKPMTPSSEPKADSGTTRLNEFDPKVTRTQVAGAV